VLADSRFKPFQFDGRFDKKNKEEQQEGVRKNTLGFPEVRQDDATWFEECCMDAARMS
jgi:hypothetical protein